MKAALVSAAVLLCCGAALAQAPSSPEQPTPPSQRAVTASPSQQTLPSGQSPPPLATQVSEAPTSPVPLSAEPHHRLVLQNDFVHVYNVMVPPLDATYLHQHDLPYLYVVLAPSEITNVVVGQPEMHITLQDGETHYNPGHFVHLLRTDSGLGYHTVTIELPRAQGAAHNLCKEVLPGQPTDCPNESASGASGAGSGKKPSTEAADDDVPYFETDEVRVDLRKVSSGKDYVEHAPRTHALLVALTNANLDANLGGEHIQFLHGGDVLWMPAGVPRRVVDFLGTHSSFLLISFKDSTPSAATP
jgi:hypothetical protein